MDLKETKSIHSRLRDYAARPEQFTALLEAISHSYDQLGFNSLYDYVHADVGKGGLGLNDSKLNALLYFNPSYEHKAVKLAKKLNLGQRMINTEIKPDGFNQYSEGYTNSGNSTPLTDTDRRLRKLKRDFPEVATRLEEGEFKNVADAERAAGIKPPKKRLKRFVIDLDDLNGSVDRFNELMQKLNDGE